MSLLFDHLARCERQLRHVERARLIPPDETHSDDKRLFHRFTELSAENQRSAIRDHLRQFPADDGVFGDFIQSDLAPQIRAAYFANDFEQFSRLMDRAIREQFASLIQAQWDKEDAQ